MMAVDEREAAGFFLNDPKKLDNPFPDFVYFRENRPVFYYFYYRSSATPDKA